MTRISDIVRNAQDIKSKIVDIEDWGCKIEIRGMDGNGRSEYLAQSIAASEIEDPTERQSEFTRIECALIIAGCFDPEDGSQCFTPEDIEMLMGKSGAVLAYLGNQSAIMSGLDRLAGERLGKDSLPSVVSTTTPKSGSGSTSPAS